MLLESQMLNLLSRFKLFKQVEVKIQVQEEVSSKSEQKNLKICQSKKRLSTVLKKTLSPSLEVSKEHLVASIKSQDQAKTLIHWV